MYHGSNTNLCHHFYFWGTLSKNGIQINFNSSESTFSVFKINKCAKKNECHKNTITYTSSKIKIVQIFITHNNKWHS